MDGPLVSRYLTLRSCAAAQRGGAGFATLAAPIGTLG